MAYQGKAPHRSDSALSTLPLLMYLAMAIGLMFADHRHGFGQIARQQVSLVTQPLWWLASSPTRLFRASTETLATRSALQADNQRKRHELQLAIARIHRLNAVADENVRLRRLLGGTRGYALDVRMVGIVDIDLDPFRQRLVLDAGRDAGVTVGQALIDSGGVMGQVVEVQAHRSIALLVSDPDHAVPVQIARSGLRTIAYGTGRTDLLLLPNIPQSADVKVGDLLITSGIGGRFPAGFPVATITRLRPDQLRLFVVGEATPAAHLDRGNEVLLIGNLPPPLDVGPPAPPGLHNPSAEQAAAAAAAAADRAAAAAAAKPKGGRR
ncbi:MAG: rod shape-determining protein MreC [Arenimonas sp.]